MIINDNNNLNKKISKDYKVTKDPYIITIGGLSCSGKTTLSNEIITYLKMQKIENTYISLDNWIIDIDKRPSIQTVRERFHYHQIEKDIGMLMQGKDSMVFSYSKKLRKKTNKQTKLKSRDKGIYIIEGVVALDLEYLNNISNIKIFVETSKKTRLERLNALHIMIKGLSKSQTKEILRSREGDENKIIQESKKNADIIFHN